ncbi:hypothetical protein [Legionella maioricensis]|uniref:Uncharacterized protein n=1 Tax=Legionella maioricensis TaxID=2896528 RepID=A0A9X2IBZ2_9GAMM|nr:hypothetical protein [Legionella maioricensis]MCL9683872.1 hypothetical protein [Legionella maioricensis]MCL9686719.1 hypothetical protein [Legionella maioricensis]
MPLYLLNIHSNEAREILIELDDLSPLLQEGLLVEAKNKKEAREYATKHHNTVRSPQKTANMPPEEIQIRTDYRNLWKDPDISSVQEVSSS